MAPIVGDKDTFSVGFFFIDVAFFYIVVATGLVVMMVKEETQTFQV